MCASRRRWQRYGAHLGGEHPMSIGGSDERAPRQFAVTSPIDTRVVLGRFQAGEDTHARAAVAAATAGVPGLGGDLLAASACGSCGAPRRLLEERVYFIGAAVAMEVGKNRMEALGEVAGDRRPHRVLLRADGGERRIREADDGRSADGIRQRERERAQAVRGLAGDRAVQFPAGAGRRSRRVPRWRRATPSCSRPRPPRRGAGGCWRTHCAMRACRRACSIS